MTRTADAEAEIADADHLGLRLFNVKNVIAQEPLDDVNGQWVVCSPESVPGFSAVGYFFGRELLQALEVPVGLVAPNWGGTLSEAWTSRETLAGISEFAPPLERLAQAIASDGDPEDSLAVKQAVWWKSLEQQDPGHRELWMSADLDLTDWLDAPVPGQFSDAGLGSFDGCVWYRRTVEVPEEWVGQPLALELGPVDDMDLTFLNGQLVGSTREAGQHTKPRVYAVDAGVARAGANVIAVCAVDTGGAGTLGGTGEGAPPMRLRLASDPAGSGLTLEGTWKAKAGLTMQSAGPFPSGSWFHANYPTALYNGMIAPLLPFGIRGAIWYQGESNRPRAAQYRTLFPAMIGDWREKWGLGAFPFYFVQIAPYRYAGDTGQAAELREAQTLTLATPNTGMAVTMDIGNPDDIHPRNKQEVGRRLALCALAGTYGIEVVHSGPMYRSMVVVGNQARLHFAHTDGGLVAEGEGVTHVTVAGQDRVFHPAEARIAGDLLVVRCEAVAHPVAVRYAWGAADVPNLKNGAGLPAPSFRTDDWEMVSAWR